MILRSIDPTLSRKLIGEEKTHSTWTKLNSLPEFRVDPNKKKTGAKILLLLGVYGRCVAAVDFSPQTFLF